MSTINTHTAVSRHAAGDLHLLRPHRCECSAARTGPFPLGLERPYNELPSLLGLHGVASPSAALTSTTQQVAKCSSPKEHHFIHFTKC